MNEDRPFEVIDTKTAYENPWIKVREDAIVRKNGNKGIYGVLEVGDSVAIVAVNASDEICIVESYRHPIEQWVWELPGGGNDGDNPADAAMRELEEEAGLAADAYHVLGTARVCNGLSTEYQTNVLALAVRGVKEFEPEDEIRAQRFVSLDDLDGMIINGELSDNQSITALYMYKQWLIANRP